MEQIEGVWKLPASALGDLYAALDAEKPDLPPRPGTTVEFTLQDGLIVVLVRHDGAYVHHSPLR